MKENVIPVNWHWELLQRVSGWASYWGFLIVPHCKEENKSISQSSLNKSSEWGKWGCLYVWKRRNGWQEGGRRKEDSKEETINLQAEEDEEEEETIQSRWWTQKIMKIKHRTSKLLYSNDDHQGTQNRWGHSVTKPTSADNSRQNHIYKNDYWSNPTTTVRSVAITSYLYMHQK